LVDIGSVPEPIFFCFRGDLFPNGYPHDVAWEIIDLVHASSNSVNILTKNPGALLEHPEKLKPGDRIGTTAVFWHASDCTRWEPGAPSTFERFWRMGDLRIHTPEGVGFWVSFEPVAWPADTLAMAETVAPLFDEMKFGKLNHLNRLPADFRAIVPEVDWGQFARDVVALMERIGYKNYTLKEELRREVEVGS